MSKKLIEIDKNNIIISVVMDREKGEKGYIVTYNPDATFKFKSYNTKVMKNQYTDEEYQYSELVPMYDTTEEVLYLFPIKSGIDVTKENLNYEQSAWFFTDDSKLTSINKSKMLERIHSDVEKLKDSFTKLVASKDKIATGVVEGLDQIQEVVNGMKELYKTAISDNLMETTEKKSSKNSVKTGENQFTRQNSSRNQKEINSKNEVSHTNSEGITFHLGY